MTTISAPWPIAGFRVIFSIYGGIIGKAVAADNHKKGMLTAAAVIGDLLLLGLTLSAIFLFSVKIGANYVLAPAPSIILCRAF